MEDLSISKRLSRFKWCDPRLYPFVEKVLLRLPEDIRFRHILDDSSFEIISFDTSALGQYIPLENQVKHLVVLNLSILGFPEFHIIHTIVHEIAHKVGYRRETSLNEMEAEELIVKWGFQQESEAVEYYRPILESEGYRIGQEWAKKQEDLSKFKGFYDEWNKGRFSNQRFEELSYVVDVMSILDEIRGVQEVTSSSDERVIPADIFLDKGIICGIMDTLKKREKTLRADSTMEEITSERETSVKGQIIAQKCQHCRHHEICIKTEEGKVLPLKPGMRIALVRE